MDGVVVDPILMGRADGVDRHVRVVGMCPPKIHQQTELILGLRKRKT